MGLPILDIVNVVGKIVDKAIPDPQAKAQLQLELAKLADAEDARLHEADMGQIEVNKVEAANPSVFVAGWRPGIGWACCAGFVYSTMVAPLFHLGMPDLSFLRDVLLGMLGLAGGMRTIEKIKGVDTVAVGKPNTPILQTQAQAAGQPAAPLARRKKFLGIF